MNTFPFSGVPRIESLHHRLKTAKGAEGESLDLIDELMVFLEDPPPGVGDRWQAGADFCAGHGIATSRMAVWRFYRAHVLEWRIESAPPMEKISDESTVALLEQARHLIALRAVESLRHPHLPPHVLVGLVQNENRRQELLLAREKFNDQLDTKRQVEQRQMFRAMDEEARVAALFPFQLKSYRHFFETLIKADARPIPPAETPAHTGS